MIPLNVWIAVIGSLIPCWGIVKMLEILFENFRKDDL